MPRASPVAGVQLTTRSLQSRAAGASRPLAPLRQWGAAGDPGGERTEPWTVEGLQVASSSWRTSLLHPALPCSPESGPGLG